MPKYLTKSRYTLGLQCLKALWLSIHKPDLAAPLDEATSHRFRVGTLIGEYARRLFAGGVLIEEDHFHLKEAVASTQRHVDGGVPAIFEATAEYGRVLCRADVLQRIADNTFDLYEVKMSTSVKEEHVPDVAIQHYCMTRAGYKIRNNYLMHVNKNYVRNGEISVGKLLAAEDVTPLIHKYVSTIGEEIPRFVAVIDLPECPAVPIGAQCNVPYKCAFYDHCNPPHEDYTINELPRGEKAIATLKAIGIKYLIDVPVDFPLSDRQRLVVRANKSSEPVINKAAIKEFLDTLVYPLYYFDFETINPAIPLFNNSRPYQNQPFQFSLHVQKEPGGACVHHEFLSNERRDPRRELIEEMLKLLGKTGSIVAYNMNFEIGVIKGLADSFPEYKKRLLALVPRFRDLIVPFRSGYYVHRDFHGSASLKDVQPVVVPSLSYKKLEIQEGETASLKYEKWMSGEMETGEWEKTRQALLQYCGLDTEAMVEIVNTLLTVK
jgi:hypothetical protein